MIRKIPITLLTGFLGSGKTTLLRQILSQPEWKDTVVLVNELGEVGLDHHLLWGASDAVVLMENGCICCSMRDDLGAMLEELFWKRLHRQLPRFSRVVIETTGLADPGPVVAALRSSSLTAERYTLANVLCTADAVLGAQHLARHGESVAQAACADVIVVTKTDLATEAQSSALEQVLRSVNPLATICRSGGAGWTADLLAWRAPTEARMGASAQRVGDTGRLLYHHRVRTVSLHFTHAWEQGEFEAALHATLARHGPHILRIKGLVEMLGASAPVVVQAVQETAFPFEALAEWPAGQRVSFLVLITIGLADAALAEPFRSHLDVAHFDVQNSV